MIPVSGQGIDHLRGGCNRPVHGTASAQSPGKQIRHKQHARRFQPFPFFSHQLEKRIDRHNLIACSMIQLFGGNLSKYLFRYTVGSGVSVIGRQTHQVVIRCNHAIVYTPSIKSKRIHFHAGCNSVFYFFQQRKEIPGDPPIFSKRDIIKSMNLLITDFLSIEMA